MCAQYLSRLSGVAALLALSLGAAAADADNYPRVVAPQVQTAFAPLPPGAIEPQGWLRDWAQSAAQGITGHLDEWHPTFGGGWKGVKLNAPNSRADGTGWPLEQCAYWLDGAIRLGYVLHDDALVKKVTQRLEPIVEGVVQRHAKTFIYWNEDTPSIFNSWACSHFGRALIAWYSATGDRRVLDALVQVYAEYPLSGCKLSDEDVSGLCNLDAMLEAYSYSGDRRLLDRVRAAFQTPEAQATLRAWTEGRMNDAHGVIAYEQYRLPILLYPWTGEPALREATVQALKWFEGHHMLPYGAPSGMENVAGVGAFRLTETCDVAAGMWTNLCCYRILGTATYGDTLERMFFNAGPGPIARDFQTMCYYQSPNRIEPEALPEGQPGSPGLSGLKFTPLGCPEVLCCVGAVNRVLPNYIMHMWMTTPDDGLAATLYGPCTVTARAGAKVEVKLTCATDYPFEETVRITVEPAQPVEFPLYLRVPAWCTQARLSVNGETLPGEPDARGYVRIARQWQAGDKIELRLPMTFRVERGFETEYPASNRQYFAFKPDEVFQRRRLPFANVVYGPLLFALPIADQDANTRAAADAKWQYALDVDAERKGTDIALERRKMPAHWDWSLDAPLVLKVPARAFTWQPTDVQPLPSAPIEGESSATIELVPYGCTKFRISMFPVTPQAWGRQAR